ncbi:hypothetical protein GQ43DRAFT_463375 [Delitschia confertaspora ATCC 74209]|uniref:Carboxymuconolactone decarboxylase-like domain-containing protein n=1 Tax=Delitschia confertaspora ATCC 74209 TaxID=1513339 RepID=A0A9P4JQC9_9PLEO|nr:hypothetical protein GQ43DRAFT_463375 [Delitschia confertaspora ATCC 74209]
MASSITKLTPEQTALKEAYFKTMFSSSLTTSSSSSHGLPPHWSRLLYHSPPMFAATLHLHAVPHQKRHLDPKTQSLISLAVASASTHLHLPAIKRHTKEALDRGASREEIVETLALTSTLGIHACNIGVPILVDVLREEGIEVETGMESMTQEQWKLRHDFEKKRGYWHPFWDLFLHLDPSFFAAYLEFSSVPWTSTNTIQTPQTLETPCPSLTEPFQPNSSSLVEQGALPPKTKELIYCAFDAAATHLYQPGLKQHMRNVIRLGGSKEEIMEVLELATLLGGSTLEVGLGVLDQELEERKEEKEEADVD